MQITLVGVALKTSVGNESLEVESRVNDVESESFRATTRVKSSQFALQTRVKSSQCTYRLESSPKSRIATKVKTYLYRGSQTGSANVETFFLVFARFL